MNIYDCIIIGAGPAGITAAVYAARQKMKTLVISKDIGGQTAWSADIENYTGFQFVTGPELTKKFEDHLRQFAIELKEQQEVTGVEKNGDTITVRTGSGLFQSKTLIVASGKSPRLLNVPGEREFRSRGVAYCAICDGPLFQDKDVAVVGGGNSALDAALQMAKIARKTYLITVNEQLFGDSVMLEKLAALANIEILYNTRTVAIKGGTFVEGIVLATGDKERTVALQGVFVEIGLVPASSFITCVEKNAGGEIKVDTHCRTSVPGIFAAGDVTDVPEKQIIIAAGEGAKAALGAVRYLSTHS